MTPPLKIKQWHPPAPKPKRKYSTTVESYKPQRMLSSTTTQSPICDSGGSPPTAGWDDFINGIPCEESQSIEDIINQAIHSSMIGNARGSFSVPNPMPIAQVSPLHTTHQAISNTFPLSDKGAYLADDGSACQEIRVTETQPKHPVFKTSPRTTIALMTIPELTPDPHADLNFAGGMPTAMVEDKKNPLSANSISTSNESTWASSGADYDAVVSTPPSANRPDTINTIPEARGSPVISPASSVAYPDTDESLHQVHMPAGRNISTRSADLTPYPALPTVSLVPSIEPQRQSCDIALHTNPNAHITSSATARQPDYPILEASQSMASLRSETPLSPVQSDTLFVTETRQRSLSNAASLYNRRQSSRAATLIPSDSHALDPVDIGTQLRIASCASRVSSVDDLDIDEQMRKRPKLTNSPCGTSNHQSLMETRKASSLRESTLDRDDRRQTTPDSYHSISSGFSNQMAISNSLDRDYNGLGTTAPGRSRLWSSRDKQRLKAWIQRGYSYVTIAHRLNRSASAVSQQWGKMHKQPFDEGLIGRANRQSSSSDESVRNETRFEGYPDHGSFAEMVNKDDDEEYPVDRIEKVALVKGDWIATVVWGSGDVTEEPWENVRDTLAAVQYEKAINLN